MTRKEQQERKVQIIKAAEEFIHLTRHLDFDNIKMSDREWDSFRRLRYAVLYS